MPIKGKFTIRQGIQEKAVQLSMPTKEDLTRTFSISLEGASIQAREAVALKISSTISSEATPVRAGEERQR